ncbi:MAG: hypothetical protein ICV68_04900 [Pyrinomonadaceae bacterium]|nr:hypothetical protein [Pyrinomonadaceae bacterium]
MYCPQCGQQQVSGEVRFCSRCGFPLGGVIELLANGGNLPTRELATESRKRSPRYEGVRQGVIMFFIGAVLVPLLGILNSYQTNGSTLLEILVPISAVLFFVGGFMRILYAAIFEEGAPTAYTQPASMPYTPPPTPPQLNVGVRASALPPAQSIPVSAWRQRPNTAEIIQPPSVTENTTRLLDDPPEQSPR